MTHPQRRAHLFTWLILGPLLCAAIALAWRARPAAPARSATSDITSP